MSFMDQVTEMMAKTDAERESKKRAEAQAKHDARQANKVKKLEALCASGAIKDYLYHVDDCESGETLVLEFPGGEKLVIESEPYICDGSGLNIK